MLVEQRSATLPSRHTCVIIPTSKNIGLNWFHARPSGRVGVCRAEQPFTLSIRLPHADEGRYARAQAEW